MVILLALENSENPAQTESEVIKMFMLNSAEHEILNAYKSKAIKNFSRFSGSDKPIMLFFLPITVKMPTFFGILTFMSRKISCSAELSKKSFFITLGPGLKVFSVFHSVKNAYDNHVKRFHFFR